MAMSIFTENVTDERSIRFYIGRIKRRQIAFDTLPDLFDRIEIW